MSQRTHTLAAMTRDELKNEYERYAADYEKFKSAKVPYDLTRGKPAPEQLDLSGALLQSGEGNYLDSSGVDCRNYGEPMGVADLRNIFADMLHIPLQNICAGNNSSIETMHDILAWSLIHGNNDSAQPWTTLPAVRFLCPTPGYDRHFGLAESLGVDLVPVRVGPDGPDLEEVSRLVGADPLIKGMWAVPTYSNPTGSIYSYDVVRGLASMSTAAPDFRIFWDNAYFSHTLTEIFEPVHDVISISSQNGNSNRFNVFCSTSKMTFAGAGVSFYGSSTENVSWYLSHLKNKSIGPNKINQLQHARFFEDAAGVRDHMQKIRHLLRPKFEKTVQTLSQVLTESGVATWTAPRGGYFVSVSVMSGTAARVVELAQQCGIALTDSGAPFPYGIDPDDAHLRLAPSFLPLNEIEPAVRGIAICILMAAIEKTLSDSRPVEDEH